MYYAMQDSDFAGAKGYDDAKRKMSAWGKQITMDESSPEGSFVPFKRYSNFAIELAVRFKADTQKHLSALFNEFYNLVQGVGGDMFNPAEKTSKKEAVKRIFNSETNDTGTEIGSCCKRQRTGNRFKYKFRKLLVI